MIVTIGHSQHGLEDFLGLLARHRVAVLADVRSVPYSRFSSQYNREKLSASSLKNGIEYAYLGRELGGRSDDPACYERGRIRYDRLARTDMFRDGLERVVLRAAAHRVGLMCAEKDPLDCHRALLVARLLEEQGLRVAHVLADGELETHADAMSRLLRDSDLSTQPDLFRGARSRADLIAEAVALRAKRVGHVDASGGQPSQRTML